MLEIVVTGIFLVAIVTITAMFLLRQNMKIRQLQRRCKTLSNSVKTTQSFHIQSMFPDETVVYKVVISTAYSQNVINIHFYDPKSNLLFAKPIEIGKVNKEKRFEINGKFLAETPGIHSVKVSSKYPANVSVTLIR